MSEARGFRRDARDAVCGVVDRFDVSAGDTARCHEPMAVR